MHLPQRLVLASLIHQAAASRAFIVRCGASTRTVPFFKQPAPAFFHGYRTGWYARQGLQPSLRLSSSSQLAEQNTMKFSLTDFLVAQKGFIESSLSTPEARHAADNLHFVIGNPAADADSIISAIGLAYVDAISEEAAGAATVGAATVGAATAGGDGGGSGQASFAKMPVISITDRELTTQRPDIAFLFELAGIEPSSQLVCLDHPLVQARMTAEAAQNPTLVTLVDHNRLVACETWTPVEIVDHHMDEGHHTDTVAVRNIAFQDNTATVASTCTLVVERYMSKVASAGTECVQFPPQVAILLLGVILLDSVNMSPSAGKGTHRDAKAMQQLLEQTNWESMKDILATKDILAASSSDDDVCRPDPLKLFDTVESQKFNPAFWNNLTTLDALGLDYKSFSPTLPDNSNGNKIQFGMSSVLQTMEQFATKPDHIDGIKDFMKARDIPLLGMMFATSSASGLARQLAICGRGELFHNMVGHVQTSGNLNLRVSTKVTYGGSEDGLQIAYFDQDNAKASRKQVAPLMLKYWEQAKM